MINRFENMPVNGQAFLDLMHSMTLAEAEQILMEREGMTKAELDQAVKSFLSQRPVIDNTYEGLCQQ